MPAFNTFPQMLQWCQARSTSDYTTDIINEGRRGTGKSNTTLVAHNQLIGPEASTLRPHWVYDAVDLARLMPQFAGQEKMTLIFDEAKNILYRRNAMTRINKAVSTIMSQVREKKGVRFWNTPDADELEGFLTKDQADVLITHVQRGQIIVRRFWKNYHAPPGLRTGRWVDAFRRTQSNPIPDMKVARPLLYKEYRDWKGEGYARVSTGLVDKILLSQRLTNGMSIGVRDGVQQTYDKARRWRHQTAIGLQESGKLGTKSRATRRQ